MDLYQVNFYDESDPANRVLKAGYSQLALSKAEAIEKATEKFHADNPGAEIEDFFVHAYQLD